MSSIRLLCIDGCKYCLARTLHENIAKLESAITRLASAHAPDSSQEKILSILTTMEQRLNDISPRNPLFSPSLTEVVQIEPSPTIVQPEASDEIQTEKKREVNRHGSYTQPPFYSTNIAFAAGLGHPFLLKARGYEPKWCPPWRVFPLKAFRGSDFTYIKIHAHWDDEALLRELNRTYNNLRRFWRRWFSLRGVRFVVYFQPSERRTQPKLAPSPWS